MNSIVVAEKGVAVARPPDDENGITSGDFPAKARGLYVVLWNNGGFKGKKRADVALLEKKSGNRIVFLYRTGPRIGRRFAAEYNVGSRVAVFKPDDLPELFAYVKDLNRRKGFE